MVGCTEAIASPCCDSWCMAGHVALRQPCVTRSAVRDDRPTVMRMHVVDGVRGGLKTWLMACCMLRHQQPH